MKTPILLLSNQAGSGRDIRLGHVGRYGGLGATVAVPAPTLLRCVAWPATAAATAAAVSAHDTENVIPARTQKAPSGSTWVHWGWRRSPSFVGVGPQY